MLKINKETVMLDLPRGNERLQLVFVKATDDSGRPVVWHALRMGMQSISIRGGELRPVVAAFLRSVAGSLTRDLVGPAKDIIGSLEATR